ncbi:pentatricopeptide repeat-containing protein At1g08070, chloroplastic-like [Magnolia sinica]|uniref:pentatricopeptide repeat-containing protein At1g08070, chloroplastic-like n=1 Tax=Magnolia sinica TaxID=86752 RepID=UPI0026595FF3|nr:pentatricopeptide repeat-containing protein At1g08070, chloroplastic-like [Magnolia sinica]
MQKQLALSLPNVLQKTRTLKDLKTLHAHIITTGLQQSSFAIGNLVAHCATAFGNMSYAYQMFDQMLEPNSFVWNTVIRGFQQNQEPKKALLFFDSMRTRTVPPDRFTFPFVIKACTDLKDRWKGLCIHGQLFKTYIESDVFVATSLIEFYVGLEDMRIARRVFDEMPLKDVVSWTVTICGYVNVCSDMEAAHQLFDEMPVKDLVVCNTMIGGYLKIGNMGVATELFDRVPKKDLLMYNTMLGGYVKNGEIEYMLHLFDEMPERDVVTWNTAIGGLVQNRRVNKAIELFHRMQLKNVRPNEVTVITVLSGCAQVGALDIGRWVHSYIDRSKFGQDVMVGTALVDMYSKCGSLEIAQHVFDQMSNRDFTAWNAMIMGFSMNGQSKKALEFFHRMRGEGIAPNEVTMVGVLCACTHAGLVDEGRRCFNAMHEELGITPKIEHYGCMVDLLGRAGLLKEAYEFIEDMPITPHTGVWGALLGACKIHSNVELAEVAIKHLIELDLEDGGYLAIMSNIYANAGRWDDVAKVRDLMREKGIDKTRGCSSITVNGEVHEFGATDKLHPRSKEVYEMITEISKQLRTAGHVASVTEVFFDVEEEEKENALHFHSEKLAVAFGLISTDEGCTLRIVKNLRICNDCHSAMKLISQIFSREIVVRDRSRFHHFKGGSCSCGDYW